VGILGAKFIVSH